jgi:alcohol dehydrogenase (cytochrome c)
MAYSPPTGLAIVPLTHSCMDFVANEVEMEAGGGTGGGGGRAWRQVPGEDKSIGKLAAYNVRTMQEVWSIDQRASFMTSPVATAGGLVFTGDFDRWFRAYDIETGEVLWKTRLGTSVQGFAMTYEVNGVQYVAVTSAQEGGSYWRMAEFFETEYVNVPGNALYVFRVR